MENQGQNRTDIEKLTVLLPHWHHHNKDHIRDQEEWLEKAEKEGLQSVADELRKAIDHSREGNRHIEQASSSIREEESNPVEKIDTEESHILSKEDVPVQNTTPFALNQIGVIRTPYTDSAPYQPVADAEGDFRVVVNSAFTDGLRDLDSFHYIYVLYYVHRVRRQLSMMVDPPWVRGNPIGVFASRSPVRPNPLGLSIVRIKRIVDNQILTSGLDVFDGTPLLDIKPYIKELDSKSDANYGWMDDLDDRDHLMQHIKGIPHD